MATKADTINGAYSQLRISGLTVNPSPNDVRVALDRLESMAAEFEGRDICLGYVFEDEPNPSTPTGVERAYWQMLETNLAIRLVPDFNKAVPQILMAQATQSLSNAQARTATVNQIQYASRQPIGERNSLRADRLQRYYPVSAPAPEGCDVKRMLIGETNDFFEDWSAYLQLGEDLASYVLSAEAGLTVTTQSLATPRVNYRINAVGVDPQRPTLLPIVVITVTTTTGRVNTRIVQFELTEVPT